MVATVAGIHLSGNHAGRPAANTVPDGSLYSCTTHSLIYQSNFAGNSWSTWASLGGTETLPATIIDAKGDLIAGTAADTAARLAIGSNGQVLTADSGETTGMKWATPSGGSGATIQYGSLKPGTPDQDFTGSSLASFTFNSQAGSFGSGDCYPQAVDGSYLAMGYDDQSGSILLTQANTDLDYRVGGFSVEGNLHPSQGQKMPGIAVVDSSGNGVAMVFNTDLNAYLIELTAYAFTGTSYGSITNITPEYAVGSREYALRITRVTNTWDGYLSMGGSAWDFHVSATGSKTITVDRVGIGTWKPNDGAARGRIYADWMDVT